MITYLELKQAVHSARLRIHEEPVRHFIVGELRAPTTVHVLERLTFEGKLRGCGFKPSGSH